MHFTVKNLINIQNDINSKIINLNYKDYNPKIIAISKNFKIDYINYLIEYGHLHFGENKVQEALEKWSNIKIKKKKIILHMVGKLQRNKVKYAVKLFDYIHSLDNLKLAQKICEEEEKANKKIKIFIQINIGNESQKNGVKINEIDSFYKNCKELNLNIIGTMCLPPEGSDSKKYFKELKNINDKLGLKEISMGMSNDFLDSLEFKSTYLRIGSGIFGLRS